jgi:hypothetical protein
MNPQDNHSGVGPDIAEPIKVAFPFQLVDAGDGWTKDPDKLSKFSDTPIIHGMLRRREVGSIVGAAKTSKTWFTLALAIAVAEGRPFLERETVKTRTLYLDYELKPGTLQKRISMLSSTRPTNFFYQCLRGQSLTPTVEDLAECVKKNEIGLVVVDSLYRTGWLTEENDNIITSRELAHLQRLVAETDCSILTVDHTAKGGGAERSAVDAARGASSKGGFYDALLVLRSTDKGPDPLGVYAALDPVYRDWPGSRNLPLISFEWSGDSAEVVMIGEVEKGVARAGASAVLDLLASEEGKNGLRLKEIMESLEMPETTVRKTIEMLVAKGRITPSPDPKHKQRKIYFIVEEVGPDAAGHKTVQNPAEPPQQQQFEDFPRETDINHTGAAGEPF